MNGNMVEGTEIKAQDGTELNCFCFLYYLLIHTHRICIENIHYCIYLFISVCVGGCLHVSICIEKKF